MISAIVEQSKSQVKSKKAFKFWQKLQIAGKTLRL